MSRRPAPPHRGTDGDWMAGAFALRDADWLRTLLTVSGPATEVGRFRAAARGTGAVPWHLDLDHEEAQLYAPMAALRAPRHRRLARQLGEVIAARRACWRGRRRRALSPLDFTVDRGTGTTPSCRWEGAATAQRSLWAHWAATLHCARSGWRRTTRFAASAHGSVVYDPALPPDWTPSAGHPPLQPKLGPRLIFSHADPVDDADDVLDGPGQGSRRRGMYRGRTGDPLVDELDTPPRMPSDPLHLARLRRPDEPLVDSGRAAAHRPRPHLGRRALRRRHRRRDGSPGRAGPVQRRATGSSWRFPLVLAGSAADVSARPATVAEAEQEAAAQ